MTKKNTPTIVLTLILVVLSLTTVSAAYQNLCLTYQQDVEFSKCNPIMDDWKCWHSLCQICVNEISSGIYCPAALGHCNDIGTCTFIDDPQLDATPPELTITSPINNEVYGSRSVVLDLESNEPASLYWIDNIRGRGRWKRISSNMRSYHRNLRFKEGFNSITFKGVDRNGNEALEVREFTIDSKKPKIRRTYPRKGFANGIFEVQFTENNPSSLFLNYGNEDEGTYQDWVDLVFDCETIKRSQFCSTSVDLSDFDGSKISYSFELTDIAGTTTNSKSVSLNVDTTDPELVNYEDYYRVDGRYVYFNIEVNEENFDEITYVDLFDSRPRERRLCSRLRDDICKVRKSFRRGYHPLTIKIIDEAGNFIEESVDIEIDY